VTAKFADTMSRLGVAPEDTAEVLTTMPPWTELEPHCRQLAAAMAHRSRPGDPMPQLPSGGGPLHAAHVILGAFDAIAECHRDFGIAEDISRETLSHFGRAMATYRNAHGHAGIALTFWDWLRYAGWLYQVGRLEVTVYRLRTHPKEAGPLFWYDDESAARLGLPFRIGDPAIGIHVPANEPLAAAACDESLARMRMGFPGRRVATCTSWLLDDQLAEYLSESSNIVAFQRRFHMVPGARDDDASMLRAVFGPDHAKDLGTLPTDTALRRAVVEHVRTGRHWRVRTGWLDL
jgi:hypothetical protein